MIFLIHTFKLKIKCNLDYPDPFVHRLIAVIPDKRNVRITEVSTFLTWFMIPRLKTIPIQYDHGQQCSEK